MTLHTLTDPEGPEQPPGSGTGESAVSYALRIVSGLLSQSPLASEQFAEARHDQAEADRLEAEAAQAAQEATDAGARVVAERHKADPHKRINRHLSAALAVCLALLDALPAYWGAQAFGLDQHSTIILTVLLCAASGGAMWLLDLFASKGRGVALRALEATLGASFIALFVLRLDYLQVTAGEDLLSAAVQAFALTALSAVLVMVGYVLLSHRVPKTVADAEHQARQAAPSHAKEAATAAHTKATRSRAALEDTLVSQVLSHEPAGIDHEQLIPAVNEAISILLKR